jgi:hypothetical protein
MNRALLVVAALFLATSARAAEPKPADSGAEPPVSSARAKAEALKRKKEEAAGKASAPKKPADSPKVGAMRRERAQLVYAAGLCVDQGKCDKDLRDEAAERFVSACRECDTVDRCDAEKLAILEGNVPRGSDLCQPRK